MGLMFGVGNYSEPQMIINKKQLVTWGDSHEFLPSVYQNQVDSLSGDLITKKSVFAYFLCALK